MAKRTDQMELTEELVRRCHREMLDEVVEDKYDYFTEDDYPVVSYSIMANKPPGPLWLFAYGSLIWKRDFAVLEQRLGTAIGWHRSFCLRLDRYRGTVEQPGLMMGLDRGGKCEGVLLRLPEGEEIPILNTILFREVGSHEHMESTRWIDVQTKDGIVKGLAFYAGPDTLDVYARDIALPQVAYVLARACGAWGSGAEYLYNTVMHLEEAGIRDDNLWELQRLTATEIQNL